MMRKPVLLLSPYANFQCLCGQINPPKPSRRSPPSRTARCPRQTYATVRNDHDPKGTSQDNSWPDLPHPSAIPTPYQIFQLKRGEPYTKHRFYQLVKKYHPDRSHHEDCSEHIATLPGTVKMERYRLIVAAHEILADPVRRKEYDRYGAGWGGRPDHVTQPYYSTVWRDSKWSGFDTNDSPFYNATWEDWERWYHRDSTRKQHTVYTSNSGFLTLVVGAVFLGAYGQSMMIEQHDASFRQQVGQMHEKASTHLRSRRESTQDLARGDRVKHFLKTRDDTGYGAWYPEEEDEKDVGPCEEVKNNKAKQSGPAEIPVK